MSRRRFELELANPYEIVEFLLAHRSRSFFEPIMKIFGASLILPMTDPLSDALRPQSVGDRNSGLTFRRNLSSAFRAAV
jgi:hypothetical protein